jgi:uncharacterized delta-60 repeat protein
VPLLLAANPGDLDDSFGTNGKVITKIDGKSAHAHSVALLENGNIVLAGGTTADQFNWNFVVAYYDASGTQDPVFGEIIENGGAAYAVAIQKDAADEEKVIAAGDYLIVRYDTDGTLDTTFGSDGNGKVPAAVTVRSILLQKDGKIIVAGWKTEGSSTDIAVARYSPDGILDTTFGKNGVATIDIGDTDRAYGVAMDEDKKILLAGSTNIASNTGSTDLKIALVRLDENGIVDSSFGKNGLYVKDLTAGIDDYAAGIAVDSACRIVVGGTSGNGGSGKYVVLRLDKKGKIDNSFGASGVATGNIDGHLTNLLLQEDDKIIVSGMSGDDTNSYFTVARYTATGRLDAGFGSAGVAAVDFGSTADAANGIAIRKDGKIVAVGSNGVVGSSDFVMARFEGGELSSIIVPLSAVYYLLFD